MISNHTILYIIGSGILALLLALFQYVYKSDRNNIKWYLAILRFITIFLLLLLIVNPKFDKEVIKIIKPKLVLAVDNSQSIKYLNKDSLTKFLMQTILGSSKITEKFDTITYTFGEQLNQSSVVNFKDEKTNINQALQDIQVIYEPQISPIVLISDGNQTTGRNYVNSSKTFNQAIFPLVLGDTISETDLKIQNINNNKYTYLENKFPVEIICSYVGNEPIFSDLIISSQDNIVFKEQLNFSTRYNSKIITPLIKSSKVGRQSYKVYLKPIQNEKNILNNLKNFSIETIDEYSKIALVSTMSHPDLGALKTSIETNKQRSVDILRPDEYILSKNTYRVIILYQPNIKFERVFELIKQMNNNTLIVAGISTDWTFLNKIQSDFNKKSTNQNTLVQAQINTEFTSFDISDYNFNSYPPLNTDLGEISINTKFETLLDKSRNNNISGPLWFTYENTKSRNSLVLAEGLWKWRMHSFIQESDFKKFDSFISKIIQYLDIKKQNNRLVVNYESIYDGNQDLSITAQYYNKNYELDLNAEINIKFKNNISGDLIELPMSINNYSHEIDLNVLDSGSYSFEVNVNNEVHNKTGMFEILEHNIEKQLINANINDLKQLSKNTNAKLFLDSQVNQLIEELIADNRFYSRQKITKKSVYLFDITFILFILFVSLFLEWLIRKYNGLI
ncbi:MAG: VWA domain-containing protein [Flavobacteriaceae bacterium]|nr:VWA domain-containing protein [Flavobacteriaceae bacterium]